MELSDENIEELFGALGSHLERIGAPIGLVVVGGANLAATGLIRRTTEDIDVIARVEDSDGEGRLVRPEPFPRELEEAVRRVAQDFGLPKDWLNAVVGSQWNTGLPPGLAEDITWKSYSELRVGFVGRTTLIHLKFYAAVDQGPESVHWQDLLALRPSGEEIERAVTWTLTQDAGSEFKSFVREASDRLRAVVDER